MGQDLAVWGGILVLLFLGIYLLVRQNRIQAKEFGGSREREKALREAFVRSQKARAARARPRRTPQQLLSQLRKRAGDRPDDSTVSKPDVGNGGGD